MYSYLFVLYFTKLKRTICDLRLLIVFVVVVARSLATVVVFIQQLSTYDFYSNGSRLLSSGLKYGSVEQIPDKLFKSG